MPLGAGRVRNSGLTPHTPWHNLLSGYDHFDRRNSDSTCSQVLSVKHRKPPPVRSTFERKSTPAPLAVTLALLLIGTAKAALSQAHSPRPSPMPQPQVTFDRVDSIFKERCQGC